MLIEQMNRLERMEYERLENGIADGEVGHTSVNGIPQPPNAHCHEHSATEREVSGGYYHQSNIYNSRWNNSLTNLLILFMHLLGHTIQ